MNVYEFTNTLVDKSLAECEIEYGVSNRYSAVCGKLQMHLYFILSDLKVEDPEAYVKTIDRIKRIEHL